MSVVGVLSIALLVARHPPEWLRELVHEMRASSPSGMVAIPGGEWRPIFGAADQQTVSVASYFLDRDPVTNAQFLGFVGFFFPYRRGRLSELFADSGYLAHWAAPLELGTAGPEQPVTNVSWFAARAYCSTRGARLPTEAEWEYAAGAGDKRSDGVKEPGFSEKLLAWYAKPSGKLAPVGKSRPNFFGVRDLHGLVWEWVLDFNSTLLTGESRSSKAGEVETFCGSGALGFSDSRDYAAFMRAAFRSSLSANYTARSLGFRCARGRSPGAGD